MTRAALAARVTLARALAPALLVALTGCIPTHPAIEVQPDPWPLGAVRIDSLCTRGDMSAALALARTRRRAAESGLQPAWRTLEAREIERLLIARSRLPAEAQRALATADSQLAIVERVQRQDSLAHAFPLAEAAVATRRRWLGADALPTGDALLALAELHFRTAHPRESDSLGSEAGRIFARTLGPDHPHTIDVTDLHGRILKNFSGRRAAPRVIAAYDAALQSRVGAYGPYSPQAATILRELGSLYRLDRQPSTALAMLEASLRISRQVSSRADDDVAITLSGIAFLRAGLGEYAAAESLAHAAIRATAPGDDGSLSNRLGLRGQMLRRLGRDREAIPLLAAAIAMRESLWARSTRDAGTSIGSGFSLHRELAVALAHTGHPAEAFEELDRSHSRVLVERILGPAAHTGDPWAGLLARVQRALPEDAAMVSWPRTSPLAFDPEYPQWACVVRHTGAPVWVRIDKRVMDMPRDFTVREMFYTELVSVSDWPLRTSANASMDALAHGMYLEWFAPLEPYLHGVHRLIVSTPEMLLGGPIGGLRDDAGRALVERFAVSYAPSALLYAYGREHARPAAAMFTRPAVLVGDPAYTSGDPGHWPRLADSRAEVLDAAAYLPRAITLTGADASAARLRALRAEGAIAAAGLLHFSSHEDVVPERVLESALVLAPDSTRGRSDSRLLAREIASSWRLDADLVSLAACRSASGMYSASDGYLGLHQAFLIAGARSLLVTVWQVDDRATAQLMHEFYARLADRTHPADRAEALRLAQLAVRDWRDRDGSHPFAHPAYWAGFALVGDAGEPLPH